MSAKFYISETDSTEIKAFEAAENGKYVFTFSPFSGDAFSLETNEIVVQQPDVFYFSDEEPISSSEKAHVELLYRTIEVIKQNNWGKVVIARAQTHQQQLNIWDLYITLVSKYKSACVYLFTSKQTGTWIGATPEVLLSAENNILKTMSLAGTRKKAEEATFTAKEDEEQQMVSDYIENILRKSKGVKNLKVSAKEKTLAGDLVHFKTSFTAQAETDFEAKELLKKLNPTPAVAGFPKKEAIEFILANENFDRSFYAGYFGLKNGNNFNYYVNLRCMQIFENSYVLYAGGGITKDSDAEAEYEETEAKMNTLKSVIDKL